MSDESGKSVRAYDETGNVRPADARYLAGRVELTPAELAERRQAEIDAGNDRLRKQYEQMNVNEPNPTAPAPTPAEPEPEPDPEPDPEPARGRGRNSAK